MSSATPSLSPKKQALFWALMIASTWLLTELVLAVSLRQAHYTMRVLLLDDAIAAPDRIDHYLASRHPVLGWSLRGADIDASGARRSPRFPDPGPALVSVYGDSFAFGSDLDDHQTWPEQLAVRLDRRVSNYGVPGYGVDQAVLRYENAPPDGAPWVVLSIHPDDLMRNLTANIGLAIHPSLDYRGLKPRFALQDDGAITLVPLPCATREELVAYAADPVAYLDDDWFAPRGWYARNRLFEFPYVLSMARMLTGERMRSLISGKLEGRPASYPYYQLGHPSRMVELAIAITERFARLAEARGQRPLVVMLPDPELYAHKKRSGQWLTQPLMDGIARHAPVISAGDRFEAALGDRPYASLGTATDHINDEGAAIIAHAVAEELEKRDPGLSVARLR